ncbi:EF-P beta-lysylation protein EpmB [Spiribacter halobius]|uniref:L-lysine 2,3-aminomutase n=1 Tax=Sediminicurvatus halobius TaxID=2182432 RepID=A0A2U2MWQ6_9GAMM|nr:EF-P beta-lysylation protein EpmB [Spiribacter halobius]PWG61297.1 EF-P beta-lysylation protein EpmB [Spiribacter halobius]UEX78970.1 EF-P beta-lysylation protein EpmB [Spiribacter halobius]
MSAETARRQATDGPPAWQQALAAAIRDPAELLRALDLDPALLAGAHHGARLFPLRVPWGYVRRMRRGDPADPLLRQVLPLDAEAADTPGFIEDPVGDAQSLVGGGVLHKYRGRALLIATGACAIHCRYCFRRHFPYAEENAAVHRWQGALAYLRERPDIQEVLLSGGDPLSLSDRRLQDLAAALDGIPHLRRLRVHSRLPVVLPERVDDALLAWLAGGRLRPVLVLHANHPAELDAAVADAVARLRGAGVALYNQAVLLRGVNDQVDTLEALGERLFELGVQPYYLHLLDRVRGAAHFEVPEREARALMRALAERVPGYLLPRLVREDAGRPWKTPVDWTRDRNGDDAE